MADRSETERRARIRGIVSSMLAKRDFQGTLDATQRLDEAGLTSLDLVNLMLAVEAEFDVEIPQAEMTPENFRTIDTIRRLVETLAEA